MNKLLIVDDSNIIRNLIKRGYNTAQFELVGTAADGVEAFELFEKHHPDVVTMDLTMPRMDGLECIEKMVRENPQVHILVISALSDKATGIRALDLGAEGFICKPFTDEQLIEALNEIILDEDD